MVFPICFLFNTRYSKLFTFSLISYIFICLEMTSEVPIMIDNVSDFSDKEQWHNVYEHGEPRN